MTIEERLGLVRGIVEHYPTTKNRLEYDVAEPVTIQLLGGFRISAGDRVVAGSARRLKKARNIVKLLALAHGNQLGRDELMDLLWPDLAPQVAANNFHRAVHFARKALADVGEAGSSFLHLHEQVLHLTQTGSAWIDVHAFEAAATTALRSNDPEQYRSAIALYSGDLLPEDRYEDWASGRRVGLHDTYLTLLFKLAMIDEQRGALPAAQSLFPTGSRERAGPRGRSCRPDASLCTDRTAASRLTPVRASRQHAPARARQP